MTIYMSDLLDFNELFELIREGRIKEQVHPTLPISIFNYTAAAQFKNIWTNSESVCRGLIVEDKTGKVIARGPKKFMNWGDPKLPDLALDSLCRATTKHDGSLGIGWTYEGHFGVATRGSFMSDQAKHATAQLTDQLRLDIQQAALFRSKVGGSTRVWEIVYPENRIVLDYGNFDGLLELGMVDNQDGIIHFRPAEMYKTDVITLAEALKMPVPDDEEGYVLDIQPEGGKDIHVKLKGETYKVLHGLLTNTNARRIWSQLAWRACHNLLPEDKPQIWASRLGNDPEDFKRIDVSKTIEETFLEKVPDEFYGWVTKQIDNIEDNVYSLLGQGKVLADKIRDTDDRKLRYETVKGHPLCTEILRYVDSGDESGMTVLAWRLSRPGDETPFESKKEED